MTIRALELYSGIGGMHCGLIESGLPGEIVAAVDINTVANDVYRHNFPNINLLTCNIQSVTPEAMRKLNANTILMSPPCQPFTRNGKCLDQDDPRTNSFIYLLNILDKLQDIKYILMENVKGFECSSVRKMFIEKLIECGFEYQEFLLCPSAFGVPNSRTRYYCLARRSDKTWNFRRRDEIIENLPNDYGKPPSIQYILEPNVSEKFLVPQKLLKWANIFDICYRDSTRSCCFTKAYSYYVEGTGSVFTQATPEVVELALENANKHELGSKEYVNCLTGLKLRFFTPTEVLSLMSFPKKYSIPENITLRQSYRLIGNSVNVKVISELLKILFD